MAWLQNGTLGVNGGGSTVSVTVPSGIVSTNYCIFTVSGDQPAATVISATPSSSNGGAIFQTIVNIADVNNSFLSVFYVTGLTAGDTFTVTTGRGADECLSHFYFDAPMVVWGGLGTRGGVSSTSVTAPSTTVVAGSTVYAYAMSRTFTSGVSSVVNSNSRTLTSLYSSYNSNAAAVNVNLWQFIEPTAATGTTTTTDTASSGNAATFHFAELLPSATMIPWLKF